MQHQHRRTLSLFRRNVFDCVLCEFKNGIADILNCICEHMIIIETSSIQIDTIIFTCMSCILKNKLVEDIPYQHQTIA